MVQVVIPMSGYGERFRREGYKVPKPLIDVDGKPIIEHVVNMFPDQYDFLFICNQEHLDNEAFNLREILNDIAPLGTVVGIEPHKLGPVHATLEAVDQIKDGVPVIINYCDFTCYWSFKDFLAEVSASGVEGAIPAYRGFHPHSLGSTFYAYLKMEEEYVLDIQEKEPYTGDPQSELASSGTYYFKSGALYKKYARRCVDERLTVGDEYYVSMVYKPMLDDRLKIGTYVLEHFMQWGTPADLEEYLNWSSLFRRFSEQNLHQGRASHLGALVVPMSGAGSRFKNEGYDTPKPLIDLGGYPMAVRAAMDMPETEVVRFVTRRDLPQNEGIVRTITSLVANVEFHVLEGLTDGQARSCFAAIDERDFDRPLTICACDNGALYNAADFEAQFSSCDILVWGATGHPAAKQKPEMFSWIDADAQGNVSRVSLKKPLQNSAVDPIVTGTFSFRNAKIFSEAAQALFDSGLKVNGEYYVDALINVAIDLGYSVQLFTVDHYIGWGTPDELRSYLYWQTCFDKWEYHPYRIEQDERVNNEGKKRLMLENDDR